MTREELKEHCEKQIRACETWAHSKGEKPSGKVYEEHKLILELLEEKPCENAISRQEVIETLKELDWRYNGHPGREVYSAIYKLSPVQPKYNASEWCHDCKEYDNDKHCCPRFNRVIRNAVEEIKQESCEDAISRAEAQTEIEMNASRYTVARERDGMGQVEWSNQLIKVSDAVDIIRHLSSVTPQEQKTGQWILLDECSNSGYYCSECHKKLVKEGWSDTVKKIKYCPNCGSYLGGD